MTPPPRSTLAGVLERSPAQRTALAARLPTAAVVPVAACGCDEASSTALAARLPTAAVVPVAACGWDEASSAA